MLLEGKFRIIPDGGGVNNGGSCAPLLLCAFGMTFAVGLFGALFAPALPICVWSKGIGYGYQDEFILQRGEICYRADPQWCVPVSSSWTRGSGEWNTRTFAFDSAWGAEQVYPLSIMVSILAAVSSLLIVAIQLKKIPEHIGFHILACLLGFVYVIISGVMTFGYACHGMIREVSATYNNEWVAEFMRWPNAWTLSVFAFIYGLFIMTASTYATYVYIKL